MTTENCNNEYTKGTDLKAGDYLTLTGLTIVLAEYGQTEQGGRWADLHLSNGKCMRVWECFQYAVANPHDPIITSAVPVGRIVSSY